MATHARKHSNLKTGTRLLPSLSLGLALVILLVSSVSLNRDLSSELRQKLADRARDGENSASFRWNPELFRWLAFGHLPSAVDWLLIRFLTDQNILKTEEGVETEAFRILNLATDVDPAFYSLYTAGANFLSVIRNDRHGALRLIEKGHRFLMNEYPKYPASFQAEYWPNAWRIGFIRGYLYLLEFQDVGKAVAAYSEMGTYPDVPEDLKQRAARMHLPSHQFTLGMNSLEILKRWAGEDEAALFEIEQKRKMLTLARDLYFLNQDFAKFNPKSRDLQRRWREFVAAKNVPERDAFGGKIFVDDAGKVVSTSPRIPVLGITAE